MYGIADSRIRIRAKRMLRRNGVTFDNDISNSMLVMLVKLCHKANKVEKEIQYQKEIALKTFQNMTAVNWMNCNRIQLEEIMKQTGGYVIKWGTKYWVSFRPARKALSSFVFERSGCKEGDYHVSLADSRTHRPFREWE